MFNPSNGFFEMSRARVLDQPNTADSLARYKDILTNFSISGIANGTIDTVPAGVESFKSMFFNQPIQDALYLPDDIYPTQRLYLDFYAETSTSSTKLAYDICLKYYDENNIFISNSNVFPILNDDNKIDIHVIAEALVFPSNAKYVYLGMENKFTDDISVFFKHASLKVILCEELTNSDTNLVKTTPSSRLFVLLGGDEGSPAPPPIPDNLTLESLTIDNTNPEITFTQDTTDTFVIKGETSGNTSLLTGGTDKSIFIGEPSQTPNFVFTNGSSPKLLLQNSAELDVGNSIIKRVNNPINDKDAVNLLTLKQKILEIDLDPGVSSYTTPTDGNDSVVEFNYFQGAGNNPPLSIEVSYSAVALDGTPIFGLRRAFYSFDPLRNNGTAPFETPKYYFGASTDNFIGVKYDSSGVDNVLQIFFKNPVPSEDSSGFVKIRLEGTGFVFTALGIRNLNTTSIVLPSVPTTSIVAFQDDIPDGNFLPLTGGTLTGNLQISTGTLNMNSNKILNVGNPTLDSDGVNRKFVSDNYLGLNGGTVVGDLNVNSTLQMGADEIINFAANNGRIAGIRDNPSFPNDAINQRYVDDNCIKIANGNVTDDFTMFGADILFSNGGKIGLLPDPVLPGDGCNKNYVDNKVGELTDKVFEFETFSNDSVVEIDFTTSFTVANCMNIQVEYFGCSQDGNPLFYKRIANYTFRVYDNSLLGFRTPDWYIGNSGDRLIGVRWDTQTNPDKVQIYLKSLSPTETINAQCKITFMGDGYTLGASRIIDLGNRTFGDIPPVPDSKLFINKGYTDTFLSRQGGTMINDINMGNNKITNIELPSNSQDVASKGYVDNSFHNYRTTGDVINTDQVLQVSIPITNVEEFGEMWLPFSIKYAILNGSDTTTVKTRIAYYHINVNDPTTDNKTPLYYFGKQNDNLIKITTNVVSGKATALNIYLRTLQTGSFVNSLEVNVMKSSEITFDFENTTKTTIFNGTGQIPFENVPNSALVVFKEDIGQNYLFKGSLSNRVISGGSSAFTINLGENVLVGKYSVIFTCNYWTNTTIPHIQTVKVNTNYGNSTAFTSYSAQNLAELPTQQQKNSVVIGFEIDVSGSVGQEVALNTQILCYKASTTGTYESTTGVEYTYQLTAID